MVKNPFPPAVRPSWSPGSLSLSPTQGEPSTGSVSADPVTNDFKWWSHTGNNNDITSVSLSWSERAPLFIGRLPWRPLGEKTSVLPVIKGLNAPHPRTGHHSLNAALFVTELSIITSMTLARGTSCRYILQHWSVGDGLALKNGCVSCGF